MSKNTLRTTFLLFRGQAIRLRSLVDDEILDLFRGLGDKMFRSDVFILSHRLTLRHKKDGCKNYTQGEWKQGGK